MKILPHHARLIELWPDRQYTVERLAEEFNTTPGNVLKWARALDLPKRGPCPHRNGRGFLNRVNSRA